MEEYDYERVPSIEEILIEDEKIIRSLEADNEELRSRIRILENRVESVFGKPGVHYEWEEIDEERYAQLSPPEIFELLLRAERAYDALVQSLPESNRWNYWFNSLKRLLGKGKKDEYRQE